MSLSAVHIEGTTVRVVLVGELDFRSLPELEAAVDRVLLSSCTDIVVHAGSLTFADNDVMMELTRVVHHPDIPTVWVVDPQRDVLAQLESRGYDKYVTIVCEPLLPDRLRRMPPRQRLDAQSSSPPDTMIT